MKNTLKLFGFSILLTAISSSFADTVVFKNGDKLSGSIVSKSATEIIIKTSFVEIKIPAEEVVSVVADTSSPAEKPQAEAAVAEAKAAAPAKEVASENAPEPTFEEEFESWLDSYRKFVHANVPEGWEFKFSGGIERRKTDSETNAYALAFEAKKKWGESDEFYARAFYDYASETNSVGFEDKTTDKYGIVTNYKHYFDESPWFFSNTLTYEVDTIKGIKDQVDEIAAFGRQFKFLDDTLVINLSAGPTLRYINAEGYSEHYVPMATFLQDLTWQLHKYAKIEEAFVAGISLRETDEYNYDFNIGLVFKLSDVLDIALRYYYSYDSVNASDAQKDEERIMLMFEIPFK